MVRGIRNQSILYILETVHRRGIAAATRIMIVPLYFNYDCLRMLLTDLEAGFRCSHPALVVSYPLSVSG